MSKNHFTFKPFYSTLNPFPNDKFRLFQSEELADDNLKYNENGIKFSKRAQNTVGKGDIASYE